MRSPQREQEEGLELFHKEDPDLILLDHWLPGINGDEVLRIIKEKDNRTPVIIMTAQRRSPFDQRAFEFPVKSF